MSEDLHDCHHHSLRSLIEIEQLVQQAKQVCLNKRLRFTPLREQVYRLILQNNTPVGAYELMLLLQKQSTTLPKVIAPPTIYRSLDFLLEHGFIHQLKSTNEFVPCCHPETQHFSAFLICQQCQNVQEIHTPLVHQSLHLLSEQAQFTMLSSNIEILGICQKCG